MDHDLVRKYNVAGPRYTSYPPAPNWSRHPSPERWIEEVQRAFDRSNAAQGISIYVHLPYCESLCTYCACNTRITVNHAVEEPYIRTVLAEWRLYREALNGIPRVRELHLGGGTPTFFSPVNLRRLVEGLLDACIVTRDAEFSFEGHPMNTTREHLDTLASLGFRRVSYGIQDFDAKVQQAIHRHQPFASVERAFADARDAGYKSINADLVFGLPFQTTGSMEHTLGLTRSLRPDRIAFYSYAHVPWIKPGQRSFTEGDLPADGAKRALYELGKQHFEEEGYTEIGMDHFALPHDALHEAMLKRTLHRNFMGYTPVRTDLMIGLGASSIGDTWTAYGQNLRVVEDYRQCVDAGRLPIFRGHLLDDQELLVRKAVLSAMGGFTAELAVLGWDEQDVRSRLEGLIADGLVELHGTRIAITAMGRPFVRNVCMAFDPLAGGRQEPVVSRFSRTV